MIKLEIYRQSNPHMPNIQGVLIHAKNEEGVEIKKNPIHPLHTSTTQDYTLSTKIPVTRSEGRLAGPQVRRGATTSLVLKIYTWTQKFTDLAL